MAKHTITAASRMRKLTGPDGVFSEKSQVPYAYVPHQHAFQTAANTCFDSLHATIVSDDAGVDWCRICPALDTVHISTDNLRATIGIRSCLGL